MSQMRRGCALPALAENFLSKRTAHLPYLCIAQNCFCLSQAEVSHCPTAFAYSADAYAGMGLWPSQWIYCRRTTSCEQRHIYWIITENYLKLKTRNTLDCDQSNYSSHTVFSHTLIEFGPTRNSAIRSADPENPTVEPNMKWIGWPLAEIWPFEIFPNVRSLVGPQYILLLTLISYTPLCYVSNVAREE